MSNANCCHLLDNSPTNQLAVSQVADWSTRWLSEIADNKFLKITERLRYIYTLNLTLSLTQSNIDSVQIV